MINLKHKIVATRLGRDMIFDEHELYVNYVGEIILIIGQIRDAVAATKTYIARCLLSIGPLGDVWDGRDIALAGAWRLSWAADVTRRWRLGVNRLAAAGEMRRLLSAGQSSRELA